MNLGSAQATDKAWPGDDTRPRIFSGRARRTGSARLIPRRLDFPLAEFPIPELFKSANILANAYLAPDPTDGVYRRGPLFNTFDGRVVPSEALAAYVGGEPRDPAVFRHKRSADLDGTRVPIDSERARHPPLPGADDNARAFTAAAIVQADIQLGNGEPASVDPALLRTSTCSSATRRRDFST